MAMTGRCVATNTAGARCILDATHGNDNHAWATADFHLGRLSEAVKGCLERGASRDFLARTLAEVDAEVERVHIFAEARAAAKR
jgi:hypothetical protein